MSIFLLLQLFFDLCAAQLFLCGVSPNQYYSTNECPSNLQTCPNGGVSLNVACVADYQCTPYSSSTSATCIQGVCCTTPPSRATTVPSTVSRFGICPSGQSSEVRCTLKAQCATGQVCTGGLCCTQTGQEWNTTCGGLAALASCTSLGQCAVGVCVSSNYCCECQFGQSYGTCVPGGSCPLGFQCNRQTGFCCPPTVCTNGELPFGACVGGKCGGGKSCQRGNICC